jgi:hypothetical protein
MKAKITLIVAIIATFLVHPNPTSAQNCMRTQSYPPPGWHVPTNQESRPSIWPGGEQSWVVPQFVGEAATIRWYPESDPLIRRFVKMDSIQISTRNVEDVTIYIRYIRYFLGGTFIIERTINIKTSNVGPISVPFDPLMDVSNIEIIVPNAPQGAEMAVGYICFYGNFTDSSTPTVATFVTSTPFNFSTPTPTFTRTLRPTNTPSTTRTPLPTITPAPTNFTPSAEPSDTPEPTEMSDPDLLLVDTPRPFSTQCIDIQNPCKLFGKVEFPNMRLSSLTPIYIAPYGLPTGLPSSTRRAGVGSQTPGGTMIAMAGDLGALASLVPQADIDGLRQDFYEVGQNANGFFSIVKGILGADLGPASAPITLLFGLIILNILIRIFTFVLPIAINVIKFFIDVVSKVLDLIIPG